MRDILAIMMIVILVLGAIVGQRESYHLYAYLAPLYEGTRRDVMIQSRAYSEGQIRELYHLKLQYQQAQSNEERATIRALALHEASAFDHNRLPLDLQAFIVQIGG